MGHGKNPQQKCPYSIILTINRENILHYDDNCKSLIMANGIGVSNGKGYFLLLYNVIAAYLIEL